MKTFNLPDTGFIRLSQLLAIFPVSRSALYKGISTGQYPAPVKLGERTAAWRVEDVKDLIARATAGEFAVDGAA